MNSKTTRQFRNLYRVLPPLVRDLADKQYRLWRRAPNHPSLRFKQLKRHSQGRQIFSARITDNYRALAVKKDDIFFWYWIGRHDEYDRLTRRS